MGIFSKKKREAKPPRKCAEVQFFPIKLELEMINAVLETLQEVSGMLMGSGLVSRLSGAFFVFASLVSGIALLITILYLMSPQGFEKRLSQVLVEKPVVAGPEKTEKAAE